MKDEWSNSGELLAVAGRVSFIVIMTIIKMVIIVIMMMLMTMRMIVMMLLAVAGRVSLSFWQK